MSETPSSMLTLGTVAPAFNLPDTISGKKISYPEIKSDIATVVMFICNHCPYVLHILPTLLNVIKIYQDKNIGFVAINSNDTLQYPEDNADNMQKFAKKHRFTFPYLFDESQAIARAYHAACTPDFYIFDNQSKCVYRGRFDDATPRNNQPVTGKDLTRALDSILTQQPVDIDQKPSLGCNIKWR